MLKMQTSSFESEMYANKERRLRVRFYKRASHQGKKRKKKTYYYKLGTHFVNSI